MSMNRLKELRKEKKLSQEDLAFALDSSQQQISNIEREVSLMNEDMIVRSADYFGVTADYLLGISDIRLEIDVELMDDAHINRTRLRELLYYFACMSQQEQDVFLDIEKQIYKLCEQKNSHS